MSGMTRTRLAAIGGGVVGVCLLAAIGLPLARGVDRTPTDGATQTYNPDTRQVTVSDGDTQPARGGPARPPVGDSHVGQVYVCGAWYDPDKAPASCHGTLKPGATGPSVADVARQAAASITLPPNQPVFGPTPSQNRWGVIPVGYPLWLWTSSAATQTSQVVTASGLTVAVSATRQGVTFAMGDGHSVSCTGFPARPAHLANPMTPSPACGHTYTRPGDYTITATTSWLIQWWAEGESGSFTIADPASTGLHIGELVSVVCDPPACGG